MHALAEIQPDRLTQMLVQMHVCTANIEIFRSEPQKEQSETFTLLGESMIMTANHTQPQGTCESAASISHHLFAHTHCSRRAQPFTRDPMIGYLKLNFASQSLRLSISILPRPCMHTDKLQLKVAHANLLAAHDSAHAAVAEEGTAAVRTAVASCTVGALRLLVAQPILVDA